MLAPRATINPSNTGVITPKPKKSIVASGIISRSIGSGKKSDAFPIIAAINNPRGPIETRNAMNASIMQQIRKWHLNRFVWRKLIRVEYK